MATKKRPELQTADPMSTDPAEDRQLLARAALQPNVSAAAVMAVYGRDIAIVESDFGPLMDVLADDMKELWAGDMRRAEAMLLSQAHALQIIFMNLAHRAQEQDHPRYREAYLKMALKAQNQSRMTLETLSTIKNPPVVYARQANINNGGQQQVNNSGPPISRSVGVDARAPAENSESAPTGLLEASDGKWMDPGKTRTTGGADSQLAPVGEVDWTANG